MRWVQTTYNVRLGMRYRKNVGTHDSGVAKLPIYVAVLT